MNSIKFGYSALFGAVFFALAGCGGGGGGTPDPDPGSQNVTPSVSVEGKTALEGSSVSITADGQDSDGTIVNYAWTQKSGTVAELSGVDSATVNFLAPAVPEDSEMVLTVTVTDDDGATSSADVTVSITANMLSVTLTGLVTDGPILNANINVSVGDQSFTATADENGVYSVELLVDDSYSDQIVNVTATGAETNSPVKLVSLLGDFATVDAASGGDDVVTKNELFGVNVTNMTTAIAALMEDANSELAITNSIQFVEASKGLDSSLVIPLATAIKLVIDYSAQNPELALPDGVEDTFELVSSLDIASEYVYNAQANAGEIFTQAQSEIMADDDVFGGTVDNGISVIDTYYQILPNSFGPGDRLAIYEDGTGYNSSNLSGHDFTWESTDTGIEITYGDGWLRSVSFPFLDNGGTSSQVETHLIQTRSSLRWITQTEENDLILNTTHSFFHYPNGELVDGDSTSTEVVSNFVKEKGIINAADVLLLNVDYSLPTDTVYEDIVNPVGQPDFHTRNALEVVFSGDLTTGGDVAIQFPTYFGDGTTTHVESVGSWSIDDRGHLIFPGDGDEGSVDTDIVFLQANSKTPIINMLNGDVDSSGVAFTHTTSDNMLLREASWTEENAVGIYDLGHIFATNLDYFWVEINADGSGLQAFAVDFNLDGVLTVDEIWEIPTRWMINSDGNVVIRRIRSRSTGNYCEASSFDPVTSEDCSLLFHEREWVLHQVTEDNAYYMRHIHRFFDTSFLDDRAFLWGITDNRYWNKIAERPVELPVQKVQNNKNRNFSAIKGNIEKLIKIELDLENRMRH